MTTLRAVKQVAERASGRCDSESGNPSYFCPVCHCVIHPTAIVYGGTDGIDCQHQGREHLVYLKQTEEP